MRSLFLACCCALTFSCASKTFEVPAGDAVVDGDAVTEAAADSMAEVSDASDAPDAPPGVTCTKPADCLGAGRTCCVQLQLSGSGTTCSGAATSSSCQATCPFQHEPAYCPGRLQLRLCTVKADCDGDPLAPNCCLLGLGGLSGRACVDDTMKAFGTCL